MCGSCGTTELDANVFAQQAVDLAQEAYQAVTFAVGGVLLDSSGKTWATQRNRVLVDKVINDPTAHGERQLVSWYYEQVAAGAAMPPPEEMTIVTSLDPCVMCTGALLTSGINVAVVAHDTYAGIDFAENEQFLPVPAGIRPQALRQFAYFGLTGGRPYAGSDSSVFAGDSIPAAIDTTSSDVFNSSVDEIRSLVSNEDPTPYDIRTLGPDSLPLSLLRGYFPAAAELNVDLSAPAGRAALFTALEMVATQSALKGNSRNAAALVDPFGNVLLIMGGNESASAIDTPFMRLTRAYAQCRRNDQNAQDGALPHPKRCTIVLLNGPDQSAPSLMDLGAYGSTMEGPLPADNPDNLLYYVARQNAADLAAMIAALPPFYCSDVEINPVQIGVDAA